ncbi:LOW QUALITY PROTEIN: U11/U12 small nuclear ribonucleoprotein 65 kDa protein-like [Actinidia eriantha]|uniref:LOW QUALITY PROTEIN: U11/U12 small nuclear ribonucleoprotein 65 kDa protein-like n=1 Tax=Actinidia eriantha TaxID=165200 RepID=UPI00258DE9CF|nr:LOW QUALITY PROTEIN: U11/U12 small nuclear ribonucleoprotein 65 kDa protein-like [Actinidia eriantha]
MAAAPPSQSSLNPQTALFIGYQGAAKVSSETSEEWAETLLIRHLPEAIPHDALCRLFSHYGASSVRPCANGRVRNCAFVDFKSEALATQAHRQLNGLCFLGKVLAVERASKPTENNKHQQGAGQPGKHSSSLMKDAAPTRDLNKGSKLGSFPSNEPIAERLDVDYPFPPHLEYAYPPPDGNILTNIVNALIAVPRFYTQVLHLMNKMNIPAPFRMALPTPPLPPSLVVPPPPPPPSPPLPPTAIKPSLADSGESELESSDEEVDDKAIGAFRVGRWKRKRIQREAIVGPAVDKYVAHEAVGLKPACLVPKEIPVIKKKNPVLQIKIVPKQIQSEKTETDVDKELMKPDIENLDLKPYATPEELERGKLPPEEILSLPMFKNYTAGNPAPVLYIKNLAKDVVADDFYFIFGSLFGSTDAAKSSLSVKLMQEGRMRGQAFVTFPSTELAHQSLNLANGYVFKSKPMIIQFGRSATIAKANTELL